ncbi:MAG: glycosyltransferase [Lutibacter sp.]|nr:glycosyltransferase [Lutibacter sp.]
MISIIICSREKQIKSDLSENLKNTVGCDYELIVIDNSENNYSIFEAYNLGIEISKGEYLCFIHDDILFHTIGWGNIVNRLFNENKEYGLIGVAGATVKSKTPTGWWDCEEKYKLINIIQHFPFKENQLQQIGFENFSLKEAVVVDGVFLALSHDTKVRFDQNSNGFHGYDLNIAFEMNLKGYKIGVTNEILLEHFSIGNPNLEWLISSNKIHKIYKKILPLTLNPKIKKSIEEHSLNAIINYCLKFGKKEEALKYWLKLFLVNPFSKTHLILINRIIKKI